MDTAVPDTLPDTLAELLPTPLHAQCRTMSVARGERLFHTGAVPEWMFFVAAGEVVLERPGVGGALLVLQRQRQGFVAEASLQSARYHCDARVTLPARITRIPAAALRAALAADAAFALRWIAMLNGELRRLRQQCERLSLQRVQDRLLHWLATAPGGRFETTAGGLKSLAAELGVSHEALYRCVARLEASGQIRREPAAVVWVRDAHPKPPTGVRRRTECKKQESSP